VSDNPSDFQIKTCPFLLNSGIFSGNKGKKRTHIVVAIEFGTELNGQDDRHCERNHVVFSNDGATIGSMVVIESC